MADEQPLHKGFVLGSIAYSLGKKADELKKRSYIEKYIPQVAIGLQEILGFSDAKRDKVVTDLQDVLERSRKM